MWLQVNTEKTIVLLLSAHALEERPPCVWRSPTCLVRCLSRRHQTQNQWLALLNQDCCCSGTSLTSNRVGVIIVHWVCVAGSGRNNSDGSMGVSMRTALWLEPLASLFSGFYWATDKCRGFLCLQLWGGRHQPWLLALASPDLSVPLLLLQLFHFLVRRSRCR